MAGSSLVAALTVNFFIGVIKLIVGFFTGSAAMLSESLHSFADTFNQILLAVGIRRSKKRPDRSHPFGYSKIQFFWAFVVAVLIFGISGTFAMREGISIILNPEEHHLDKGLFVWNLVVLGVAAILEAFALKTAINEANKYKQKFNSSSTLEAIKEMQDPVLLSLLTEDSLALAGLLIAFIGSLITYVTEEAIYDGITSVFIGFVLMTGGILLAVENKEYLIGKAVGEKVQNTILEIVRSFDEVEDVQQIRTMLLGPNDMILALDIVFTPEAEKGDIADIIDQIETKISEKVDRLQRDKIFIEAQ